jgi:hypothetical protein
MEGAKSVKVFIIMLNYNGRDFIQKALLNLFRIDYPNVEIIFVDNNSQDGSFEAAKRSFSKLTFIKNSQNLGFSAGNNVGIKYALERGADYVLLLNPDIEVAQNFLSELVSAMEKQKTVGIGSPVIFGENGRDVWFSGGKINWFRMRNKHKKKERRSDYFGSDFISGCAMMIRAEVFKKIGLLDEDYFLYWEDTDFSFRARRAGYKLGVFHKSQITHLEKSEENKKNKIYWLVISGLIFFQKNTFFALKPWIFFYTFLRKIKNKADIYFRNNESRSTVQKAYQDFSYAKKKILKNTNA